MRSLRTVVALSTLLAVFAAPTPAQARTFPSGPSHSVTLVTGDVVRVSEMPGGKPAVAVDSEGAGYQLTTRGKDTYVVPVDAITHVDSGKLDDELFNVTRLIADGYHDAARKDLPLLLVQSPNKQMLEGAKLKRRLGGATAVAQDKKLARKFWKELKQGLKKDIISVWLDRKVRAHLTESVPKIGAPQAWASGFDGSGVKVAVLDTGYDPRHPDLTGKVAAAQDFVGDGSAVDGHGHGTHVAATIAGAGNVKGVAPGSALLVGRVLGNDGTGEMSWVLAGMEWAVAQGAKVVNISLGAGFSDGTDPLSMAVNDLSRKSGALFVIAAGNTGPDASTILAPGAASDALTVGAVTKDDRVAAFSARGPRLGDFAAKPEIVAPAVGIVAARAEGTAIGELIDARYTSLSGTSMATPHVAGAAALLAQQHPSWRASDLKSALVSSSKPLDAPVSAVGAGRVDAAAAIRQRVHTDTSTVGFGHIAWTGAPRRSVNKKVTYRNDSPAPVTLDLSASASADGNLRAALTISPSRLTIPSGGKGSATLTLDPDRTDGGVYSGHLTVGSLRTPISFAVEGKTFALTIGATGRDGKPVGAFSQAQLWNLDTGELTRGHIGTEPATVRVPPGRYALMVFAFTVDSADWPRELTVLGNPELNVTADQRMHFDARDAAEIEVRTPQEAKARAATLAWQRVVGQKSIITGFGLNTSITSRFSAAATEPARAGTFEFTSHFELAEPPLAVSARGLSRELYPEPVENTPKLNGGKRLTLIDGATTPPALWKGAAVLLQAVNSEPSDELLKAAADAGASVALLYPGTDEYLAPWTSGSTVPTYSVQRHDAQTLLSRTGSTLELTGTPESPYSYQLLLPERQRIPASLTYDTTRLPMAKVDNEFHDLGLGGRASEGRYAITPTALAAYSAFRTIPTPLRRTDYLIAGQIIYRQEAAADLSGWFAQGAFSGLPRTYAPGQRTREVWFPALTRPAVPVVDPDYVYGAPANRSHDVIRVAIPHFASGGTDKYGWIDYGSDTARLALYRDGRLVGETDWPNAQFTVPGDRGNYTLSLDVERDKPWWTTSVRTHQIWKFASERRAGITVLPLLQLDYELSTDLRNTVDAAREYSMVIRPCSQPGTRPQGAITLQTQLSYDDGATWVAVQAKRRPDGSFTLRLPAAPRDGFATLRVTATDTAGNSLEQTITRAWRVTS